MNESGEQYPPDWPFPSPRAFLAGAARRRAPIADREICTCQHAPADHGPKIGRCRERDSYGLPCACPSFELEDLSFDEAEYREQIVDDLIRVRP